MKIKIHMYAMEHISRPVPQFFRKHAEAYRGKAIVSRYSVFRKCKSNYKWRK